MTHDTIAGSPSAPAGRDFRPSAGDVHAGWKAGSAYGSSAGNLDDTGRSQVAGTPPPPSLPPQSQLLQDLLESPTMSLEIAMLRLRVRQDQISVIHLASGDQAVSSLQQVTQKQIDRIRTQRDELIRKLKAAKPGFWSVLGKVFSKAVSGVIGLCTCAAAVVTVAATGGAAWPLGVLAVVSFNSAMSSFVGVASDISAAAGGPSFSVFSHIGGPKGLGTLLDGLFVANLGGVAAGAMTLGGVEDSTVIMAVSITAGIAGAAALCLCDAKAGVKFVGYADNLRRFTKFSRGAVEGVEGAVNVASGSVSTVETKAMADAKGLEAEGVRNEAHREQTQAFVLILAESRNDLLELEQVMNRVLARLMARMGSSLSALASAVPERA